VHGVLIRSDARLRRTQYSTGTSEARGRNDVASDETNDVGGTVVLWGWFDEAFPHCEERSLRARGKPQLAEDVADMRAGCALGNA
jgi:hypothetical protein